MKAIVNERYGSPDVLAVLDVAKPQPGEGELLIRVHAASVNAYDWRMLRADPFLVRLVNGLLRPKHSILGADVSGVVEAVGTGVTGFQPGDAVLGEIGGYGNGSFAEYALAPPKALVHKPAAVSFAEAAAAPMAALTALQGLRDVAQIKAGEQVLINGASGGVGSFAVQLARHYGAEVTAVCSTRKLDHVRGLGAHHVIDYTQEDVTRSGRQYDLVLAVNGYHPLSAYRRIVRPGGRYVMAGGSNRQLFEALLLGRFYARGITITNFTARVVQEDLATIARLLDAGEITSPVDRCFPLAETADAIRYVEAGRAAGKVVIMVREETA